MKVKADWPEEMANDDDFQTSRFLSECCFTDRVPSDELIICINCGNAAKMIGDDLAVNIWKHYKGEIR